MYHVFSKRERQALQALTTLGARLAEQPDSDTIRADYLAQREVLRQHARSGALVHRAHTPPVVRRTVSIDPTALADYLVGSTR